MAKADMTPNVVYRGQIIRVQVCSQCSAISMINSIFIAQRYASAVYAMTLCLSVINSGSTIMVSISSCFWHEGFLSPRPILCCKEIRVTQK